MSSTSHFFALVSRMKYINRWALMKNTSNENLCEHSFEVAIIAHALCIIGNERLGHNYDADKASVFALYHDFTEIITGDMPTPIKYKNDTLKTAYKNIERETAQSLVEYLPNDLKGEYEKIMLDIPDELKPIIKAADKISALIKCTEEMKMGNNEFKTAKQSTYEAIRKMNLPEADMFLDEFIPSYSLTLDELK